MATLRRLHPVLRAGKPFVMSRRTLTQYALPRYLVTPEELHAALQKNVPTRISTAPRIIPVCASWFLPNDPQQRTGYATFLDARIPHARFFDLDAIKDRHSPYPHMLPTPIDFADAMGRLGIHRDDSVVVYDTKELGILSAPRVAWTFRVFGHPNVHVLNNFRLWVEQGYPVESGEPRPVDETDYRPVPDLDAGMVATFEQVREHILERGKEGAEEVQILDARSGGRWAGSDPEPREGLSSGHMPGSFSIPFTAVLNPTTKAFLSPQEIRNVFKDKGIDPSKPVITSCGTGVTASVLEAALREAGYPEEGRRVYDGSWTEWAQRVKPEEHLIQKEPET